MYGGCHSRARGNAIYSINRIIVHLFVISPEKLYYVNIGFVHVAFRFDWDVVVGMAL